MTRKPRSRNLGSVRRSATSRKASGSRKSARKGAVRARTRLAPPSSKKGARKRSAPRAVASGAMGASGTATLPAPVTPTVMHRGPARVEPQFPQDDYDYKYLDDFLSLSSVPRHCRGVIFGCGKGEEAVYLCDRGYRVTGLDADRNAVGLARERAWLNDCDVDFMIGDVFETSALLPAESFGLATDRSVFQAIQGERERRRYLEAVRRLLLPGGVFLLSATRVSLPRRGAPRGRRSNRQGALLVQEGGEVVGEVLRANLQIVGRHLYPLANGEAGKAELILYCRK